MLLHLTREIGLSQTNEMTKTPKQKYCQIGSFSARLPTLVMVLSLATMVVLQISVSSRQRHTMYHRVLPVSVETEELLVPSSIQDASYDHRVSELYYGLNSKARTACEALDYPIAESEAPSDSSSLLVERFEDCMNALEDAEGVGSTLPGPKNPSCGGADDVLRIHTFWESGELPRTAQLALLSIFSSQECFQIIVWTMNIESRALLASQPFWDDLFDRKNNNPNSRDLVSVRTLDISDLSHRITALFPDLEETLFLSKGVLNDVYNYKKKKVGLAALSDVVRLLVLAAYGGIYMDLDILVLQSLRPLISRDFFYRWSTQYYCNTAVFALRLRSANTMALLNATLTGVKDFQNLTERLHPRELFNHFIKSKAKIELLPSAYFDPLWSVLDAPEGVSSKAMTAAKIRYGVESFNTWFQEPTTRSEEKVKGFFRGAFGFHWHNQWQKSIWNETIPGAFWKFYVEQRA